MGGCDGLPNPHGLSRSYQTVRTVWRLLNDYALVIVAIIVASLVTSGNAGAQQRPAPKHRAYNYGDAADSLAVREYTQPFIYSLWWAEIATCEGLPVPSSAQQASVQWFIVPSNFFTMDEFIGDPMLAGTWDKEPSVYMGYPYVYEQPTVMHEMLHVELRWAGYDFKNFHPVELFENCGIHITMPVHG